MDLTTFRRLLSPAGQRALQTAAALEPREQDFLTHFSALSRTFPAELARAALETAILRREATAKFPFAEHLYFTRPALEQASSYEVSAYRVQRLRGFSSLVDLGCSIGADTQALATLAPVIGIDLDPLRLAMARANLDSLGLGDRVNFFQADLRRPLPLSPGARQAFFFDPARRTAQRRLFSVRDYQPPLEVVRGWQAPTGVKISPGVKLEQLAAYDAEVEFISLHGELKEAVLWFGSLKNTPRRATLLPGPHTLLETPQAPAGLPVLPLSEPQTYLYEPDPAVIRAGLVGALGMQLEAAQLDAEIAYLTAAQRHATPFARAWQVEAWFPFSLKRLRAALRERQVGRVVIKKRGSPLEPDALQRDLRLQGDQERVVFLTHHRGRPIVVLCLNKSQE